MKKTAKKPKALTREALEAAIVAKGVRDEDGWGAGFLRFAVHEAAHAIQFDLEDWSSDAIHEAISDSSDMMMGRTEIDARAVEWIVLDHYGALYDVEKWAFNSFMEALKNSRLQLPKNMANLIRVAKDSPRVKRIAERILRGDF